MWQLVTIGPKPEILDFHVLTYSVTTYVNVNTIDQRLVDWQLIYIPEPLTNSVLVAQQPQLQESRIYQFTTLLKP